MKDITIIGGGLAAILSAIAFRKKNCAVRIIERYDKQLAKGIAYASPLPYQLLNVPAGKMSLDFSNDDDFIHWLSDKMNIQGSEVNQTFYPRDVYAKYIADKTKSDLSHVSFVIDCVKNITRENGCYTLHTSRTKIETDIVVVATGNAPPKPIIDNKVYEGIVIDEVNNIDMELLLKQESIAVAGTGLTAVDVICSLHQSGYKGKIMAISRRGLLPLPHKKNPCSVPINIELLRETDGSLSSVFSTVKEIIKCNNSVAWQDVIDSMRPLLSTLWQDFTEKDKVLFLTKLKPYWEVIRHRMPFSSHEIIEKMKKDKQLYIIKGHIEADRGKRLMIRNSLSTQSIDVPIIINCTGANTDIATQQSLFSAMLLSGKWVQDKFKLGIVIDEYGRPISDNGKSMQNMYVMGALRRAKDYDCIALRELKLQALQIADFV